MKNKQKLKRPIRRKIRFSKEEGELINRKIEESFFPSFQNFTLHLLIQGEIRRVDYSELNRLTTEIHKIGISINQMARLANRFHKISSEDIRDLTDEIQSLNALVQSELNELVRGKEQSWMVYTKHFVTYTFDKLNNACPYIEDTEKTEVTNDNPSEHLERLFQYIMSDDKTYVKKLVSRHGTVDPANPYEEFKLTKLQTAIQRKVGYAFDPKSERLLPPALTELEKDNAALAHHLVRSFSPEDDLTPEKIHEIGYDTAMELTGGEYEFMITTHVDKEHLRNHITFSSANLKTGKAFRWQKGTKKIFERISDKVAAKEGTKIIEKSPKQAHIKYTKW